MVLALGFVTFARLVEISREDLQRLRDIIETRYRRHSAWLILTSAASLIAILNSVVLGTGLTALASALGGGFRGWDVAAGLAGAALSCWLMLRFEARALDGSI